MTSWLYLAALFVAKVFDNALGTAKTILVQRNQCVLAGLALGLSNFIYLSITKDIVTTDSTLALVVVSIASGVGCCLAVAFNNKFSKEKTYVNVIMSDDKEVMMKLRDFLAENKITNVASDSYTRLIDEYIEASGTKFKRLVQDKRVSKR